MFLGIALKALMFLVFLFVCNRLFYLCSSYVPSNSFVELLRAADSVLVGPCRPALLNCIYADAHTAVLLDK